MILYESFYETTMAEVLADIRDAALSIGLTLVEEDAAHVMLTDGKFYYSYKSATSYIYESYSVDDTYNGNYLDNAVFTKQVTAFSSPNYRVMVAAWKYNDDYGFGIYQVGYTLVAFPVRLSRLSTSVGRNIYVLTGDTTPAYYEDDGTSIGTWSSQIATLTMNANDSLYKRNQNVTGAGGVIIDNEFFINAYNVCLAASLTDRKYEVITNDGRYIFPSISIAGVQNLLFKHEEV